MKYNFKVSENAVSNIQRLLAYVIDWYLATMIANIPTLLVYSITTGETEIKVALSDLPGNLGIICGVISFLIYIIYMVVIPTYVWKGQTIGKKVLGFKVIKEDKSDVTLGTMAKREILGTIVVEGFVSNASSYLRQLIQLIFHIEIMKMASYIFGIITIISVLLASVNPKRKMIHDYIAKTYVIPVKK